MLDPETAALSGPDQLDAIADQAEGSGLQVNAEAFRRLARQWRRDQLALENAEAAVSSVLRASERSSRAVTARHALTPTDSRR